MKRQTKKDLGIALGIAGSLIVGVSTFVTAAYVRGRRSRHSPLLPKEFEKKIDRLVSWADQRFGKEWVDKGMDVLEVALRGSSGEALVRMLEPVFRGDWIGRDKQWLGSDKLRDVAKQLNIN